MKITEKLNVFKRFSPGFLYEYKNSTLCVFFHDQKTHNALSEDVLTLLKGVLERIEFEEISRFEIHLVASHKKISCSGLHLKEFAEHCSSKNLGEDVLSEDYLFVRVMTLLRLIAKKIMIVCVVDGHLLGAGMELALSCTELKVTHSQSLMMLPYLRIGLPYYREGLEHMIERIGFDMVSRMILCEKETFPTVDVLKESILLNKKKRQDHARKTLKVFDDYIEAKGVFSCRHGCRIQDATGGLVAILSYHQLLALKVVTGVESRLLFQMVENYRLQACTESFFVRIQEHAKKPSKANEAFQKQLRLKK
ncbi:MAG: enoyl-CoA hydratase/isomerase family protein [Oligoflexales bacterium]